MDLNSLPDAPTANIFNFLAGGILDFVPLEYRNAYRFTQIIDVKHLTEKDAAGIAADMRRSEGAKDWYTFSQQSEVNEVSLRMLSRFKREK
jgi:hypothetical protein